MQQTLSLRDWPPSTAASAVPPPPLSSATSEELKRLLSENAVVVLARRGCCMCHVVKLLLRGHGVNPTILDVDDENEGAVTEELKKMSVGNPNFPAIFVGGESFGGLEDVMGAHISGELVPRLRKARALWL